jgi:hypothetical protein
MRAFKTKEPPQDAKDMPRFVREMQQRIEKAANEPALQLNYLGTAPSRPQDGLYFSEAGVLGASRGLYRYDSASGTYTFIA